MNLRNFLADTLIGCAFGLVVALMCLIFVGCSPAHYDVITPDEPTIGSRPATGTECAMGGTVILINGSPSPSSVICSGNNGLTGPQGNQGATGATGASGQDSTPITFVQFCQGVTPQYPSTFPEIGLCINHNLYGVYSANNGFMVLLPPGSYSSNGINASCNFTVLPDCGLQ